MTMTRRVVISSWNTMTLDLPISFLMLRRSEFSVEEFNFGRSNFNVSEEAAKIELTLSEIPRNRQPVAWRFQIPPNFCQSWELQPQKRPCFAFHGEIGSTTRDVNVGFTSQINHHLISLSYQTLKKKKKKIDRIVHLEPKAVAVLLAKTRMLGSDAPFLFLTNGKDEWFLPQKFAFGLSFSRTCLLPSGNRIAAACSHCGFYLFFMLFILVLQISYLDIWNFSWYTCPTFSNMWYLELSGQNCILVTSER